MSEAEKDNLCNAPEEDRKEANGGKDYKGVDCPGAVPESPELQKVLRQISLGVEFLKEASKVDLSTRNLSQMEDTLKSIESLTSQFVKDEDLQQIANHLSSVEAASVFLKVMRALKTHYNVKNWPCLFALRAASMSLSNQFEFFCSDLGCVGFVTVLVNELKLYEKAQLAQNGVPFDHLKEHRKGVATCELHILHPEQQAHLHQHSELQYLDKHYRKWLVDLRLHLDHAEEFLVVSALCTLGNCAKISVVSQILWDMQIMEVLSSYTKCPLQQVYIPAMMLTGLLSLDTKENNVSLNNELIVLLVATITIATTDTAMAAEVGYIKMTATELLRGTNGLALNERNAILLLENGVLSPLIEALLNGDVATRQSAVDLLWTLAMENTVREQLCVTPEVLQALEAVTSFMPKSKSLTLAAKCSLLRIKGWNQLEDVVNTTLYVEHAYQQRRYHECVRVCDSLQLKTNLTYTGECLNRIKLLMGKSLYYIHKYAQKHFPMMETPFSAFKKKELFINAEKAIQVLGSLLDVNAIDEEGVKFLDLSMIDYIRETNNLKNSSRCLLCHSKSELQGSHVIPNFVLSGFAKGMKMTKTKKDYLVRGGSSGLQQKTPRKAVWWMLCSSCELRLSESGESPFAKEFFHKVYNETDPSSPTKEHKIAYSKWLYQFAAGIVFRGLAVNPKGISGFINEDEIYGVFTSCRQVILCPDITPSKQTQFAMFINPLLLSLADSGAASTLHRILHMPGFMYLVENEEKVGHFKIPRVANFFLAHLGMMNIVIKFPSGDVRLPESSCINTCSGDFIVPEESQRLHSLPVAIWESLGLAAQTLEVLEMRVTQKRLQDSDVYKSLPAPPEIVEDVFGLTQAKHSDMETLKKIGFQPSSDPKFPKCFNLLPLGFVVKRGEISGNSLILPLGHKLLLHRTFDSPSSGVDGVTFFLCVGDGGEHFPKDRPYIIKHRYKPGLYINMGFFISAEDLHPEELLPDKQPKAYAEALLADLQSTGMFQYLFSDSLKNLDVNVLDLLELHPRESLIVKCVPRCWFCEHKCDACFKSASSSVLLYQKTFVFCSENCRAQLVKSPSAVSALPIGFEIKNEFDNIREIRVPEGHIVLAHATTPFVAGKDKSLCGDLTVFLCKANHEYEYRPYVLCHLHSLLEQFSIGIYISTSDLVPMELLPGTNYSEKHAAYVDSLYSSGIVTAMMLQVLNKHRKSDINDLLIQSEDRKFYDKRCEIPCWYCKDKCANCFTTCPADDMRKSEYCSDACREMHKSSPHVFSSLPEGFVVNRSFNVSERTVVTLPRGHHELLHTAGSSSSPDGTIVSEMTIILCIGEENTYPYLPNRPYVLFQEYKPRRNRLANVGFFISPNDLSIQEPMCADDVAGQFFVDKLKSEMYNIPLGIKEALRRRGFADMNTFLQECGRKTRTDIKCSPPCWFCKDRCDVCLQPAELMTDINGEAITHCSDTCLQVLFQNPGIIQLLPPGFEVKNNPNKEKCGLTLPGGHQVVLHICGEYRRKDGRNGCYTLILCTNTVKGDEEFLAYKPYVLYHQFNSLRKLTFGFHILEDNLEPHIPLPCATQEDQVRCLRFMQQLVALEPIGDILRTALKEPGVSKLDCKLFEPENLTLVQDKVCDPPCWYCRCGVPDVPKIAKVESKEVGVAVITLQPIQTKLGPTPGSFKVKVQPESLLGSNTYDIPFALPTYGDHTKVECRIEGLSVGEIYTFTASVSNTFGESDFCSPMYFTVPGVPDIPQIVNVESKEPSVVIVTLQTNQAHIDPTLGSFKFIVKAEPESSRTSFILMKSFPVPTYCNGDKVECVVENLLVGGTYTFTASACNEFGESDFCAPKKFTVPGQPTVV